MRKFLTLGIVALFLCVGFSDLEVGGTVRAQVVSSGLSSGLFSTSPTDYEIITYQDAGTIRQQRLIMKTNPNFALPNPQNAKFLLINKTQCEIPATLTRQQDLLCRFILPGVPCVYIPEDHVLSCRAYYDLGNLGKGRLLEENDVFYVQVKTMENGLEKILTHSPDFQFSSHKLTILSSEEPTPEEPQAADGSASPSPESSTPPNRFVAKNRASAPAISSSGGSESNSCMHLSATATTSMGLWEILCGPWTLIFLFLILIRLSLPSRKRRPGKNFSRSGR